VGSTDDMASSPVASGGLGLLTEPLTPELVRGLLRTVIDPELGVNIVDLGRVYGVVVEPAGSVAVEMTLTTPGCPLGGFLDDQIRACLAGLPQVSAVRVELVWEPPWDPAGMSEAAKAQLGWRRARTDWRAGGGRR
jgi:metal-sulfur cluster biosynthetic enzyme